MSEIDRAFLAESARLLGEVYPERIGRALAEIAPADAWWRPHPRATSIGNLLLHLEGNVHQWILAGLGGERYERDRPAEFAALEGAPAGALLERLVRTARAAADTIARLPARALAQPLRIQGFDTTGMAAILHVVEHFSWHTGQIVWIAKLRAGAAHGIQFHDDAALARART